MSTLPPCPHARPTAIRRLMPRLFGPVGLVFLAVFGPTLRAQGGPPCVGEVLISEFHHPASVAATGPVSPTPYLELLHRDLANPAPFDVGGLVITIVSAQSGTTPTSLSFTLPAGTLIPEAQPDPSIGGRLRPGALVIAPPGPLPNLPGPSPLGVSARFTVPTNALFDPLAGAPGSGVRVRIQRAPTPNAPDGIFDELILGPDPGGTPASFGASGPPLPPAGHANRLTFLHNCSTYNYETTVRTNTPGRPDPRLDHVGGFRFGTSSAGVPFTVSPIAPPSGPVSGAFFASNVPLRAVLFPLHPEWPEIIDPAYDRALQQGIVAYSAPGPFTANNQLLEMAALPAGLNWSLSVPPSTSTTAPGVLQIDSSGPINEVPGSAELTLVNGQANPLRIVRTLADAGTTDATVSGSGDLSEVQKDIERSDTGGPDLWCELVVYDGGGNAYRVKVRNWPQGSGGCSNPAVGLGSDGSGSLTVVALCFSPSSELFLLPSLTPAIPTGSGPFLGLVPDVFTTLALGTPLGTPPFHVLTDPEGLSFFQYPTGTLPLGITIDWLGAALPAGGAPEIAPVSSISL